MFANGDNVIQITVCKLEYIAHLAIDSMAFGGKVTECNQIALLSSSVSMD